MDPKHVNIQHSTIIVWVYPVPDIERPHEWVVRQLRSAILDGTYVPGDKLPVERELSERFKVSRSAVRQALLILDQQGLVRVKPGVGGGPFVAREPMPAAITAFENLLTVDESSLDEFIDAKMILEPAIAAHAVTKISRIDLDALEDNMVRTREADRQGADLTELSMEFHEILFRAIGNRFIDVVLEILNRSRYRLPNGSMEFADVGCVLEDHQQILNAISRGSATKVSRLMSEHITRVWSRQLEERSGA